MKKSIGFNLLLVILVAGLMATMSCAKKTPVSESVEVTPVISDEEASAAEALEARQAAEREKAIRETELAQQRRERAAAVAKHQFENENVYFAFDSWKLSAVAKSLLKSKADYLSDNHYISIIIEGHCDERGTTEYNLALGESRARAVKSFLTDLGIAANRMTTISYGEEKPLDRANKEDAYAVNRRAQIVIE